MFKAIKDFLARCGIGKRDAVIKSLQVQLAAAKAESARTLDNYLGLVDEHADLRVSYGKLAFERLHAWGLDKADDPDHAGDDEKCDKARGLAAPRRRPAPAGEGK